MTTQIHVPGNLPQGVRWPSPGKVHSLGAHSPWHAGPPLRCSGELRWSITDAFCQVRFSHQSVTQAGPQVVGDSAEAVGSGRAPTCTTTLIPHTGGDLSWAGRSSSVIEYGVWMWHVHTNTHMQRVDSSALVFLCVAVYFLIICESHHVWTQSAFVCTCLDVCQHTDMYIYKYIWHFEWKLKKPDTNFFLSSSCSNQKQMSACLEGLFKHEARKIYGRV